MIGCPDVRFDRIVRAWLVTATDGTRIVIWARHIGYETIRNWIATAPGSLKGFGSAGDELTAIERLLRHHPAVRVASLDRLDGPFGIERRYADGTAVRIGPLIESAADAEAVACWWIAMDSGHDYGVWTEFGAP